jgi:glycosyltransferase involved in cell wall biosynthesis
MAHLSGILINFLVLSLRYSRDSCVEHGIRIGGPDLFRALRLLVVGSDDPIFFRPVILELRMQDRLRFEAPSGDVLFFYAAADLYVSPSLEDSFGPPILEAMACGLPVIASSHAGASEMIHDGGNRIYPPRSSGPVRARPLNLPDLRREDASTGDGRSCFPACAG